MFDFLRKRVFSTERQNQLQTCTLSENASTRRTPAKRLEISSPEDCPEYDWYTLFYDCYFINANTVRLQGPPFLNLKKIISGIRLSTTPAADAKVIRSVSKQKCSFVDISVRSAIKELNIQLPSGQTFRTIPNSQQSATFKGRNVLITMVKYDCLEWISNWVEYYTKAHSIDAVLIYNNNAPDYNSDDILAAIKPIKNLKACMVVDWFFPYGPKLQDGLTSKAAYCQVGALQHARWRFLNKAKFVLNADIDELVVCKNQAENLFSQLKKTNAHYVSMQGFWTIAENDSQYEKPKAHRHYKGSYHSKLSHPIQTKKWIVSPKHCPEDCFWGVHKINAMTSNPEVDAGIEYRHFPEINAGWKCVRTFQKQSFQHDPHLFQTYTSIGWT